MIDIKSILYEICDDERVFDKDIDLIDSGLLDSYAFIELFSRLEDEGVTIQPTRVDRNLFRNVEKLEELINEYQEKEDIKL